MKQRLYKSIFTWAICLMGAIAISGKVNAADITTAVSGPWNSTSTWTGGVIPGPGDNVFIQAGHTLTIDVPTATVTDLHLSTTGILAIGTSTFQISGKIRAFTGAAPGSNSTSPAVTSITTSGAGKLQFIGASRNITVSGEWGGNTRNFTLEFALTAGATGTISTAFKAGDIIITSGIILANSDLRCDFNTAGSGTLTVKSGATLRMASNSNIQRVSAPGATSHIASVTVESGATLEYSGATVGVIGASAINFNGLVYYSNSGAQTLVSKGGNSGGVDPTTYTDLTLQAAAKTLSVNTTVNGILSMRANAATPSLVTGSFTLTYGPLATLQYRGASTAAQTTADPEWPASGSTPPNVEIFNANTVTLHASRTITGNLKISGTGSKFILGANSITAGSVSITGVDDGTKYVVTDGAGTLTVNNIGATAVKFPVGPSTGLYHPATITNAGTVDNYSVRVSSSAPPCAPAPSSVNAVWDITEAVPGGSNCTLSLDFTGAATGAFFTPALGTIAHCNGAVVDYNNGTVTGNLATGVVFTSFSPFVITSDATILPVRLTGFTADKSGNLALVKWSATEEQQVKDYTVQRSSDGLQFGSIGSVRSGAGVYTFTDRSPLKGTNFYRLKITDADGRVEFSKTVTLAFDKAAGGIKLYPTVATDRIFVVKPDQAATAYAIFASSGQAVKRGLIAGNGEISLNGISSGSYYIQIGGVSLPFVKQ